MKILKIINNNIVSSVNEDGKEIVVMGKGIGFRRKPGEEIEADAVEKIFSLPRETTSQFEELVADIPYEHMQLAEEIIRYAKAALGVTLNKNIYITLTDHLSYAIERKKQGIEVHNEILWEIQKFYQKEYQAGLEALEIVKKRLGVGLSEDEAGFIALHIVNAEMDADIRQSATMPGAMKDILNIIRYTMGKEIDMNTLSFERMVMHLKFFLQRILKHEACPDEDEALCREVRERWTEEYECALRIKEYIKAKLDYETPEEELMCLTLHISRVSRAENE